MLVRRIRSAKFPVVLDDSWPRLLGYVLFWVSTALLAVLMLVADPVFGSFVVGVPLLVVVLVRERGLDGIPTVLLGAAIGSSLVFSIFLGQYRGVFSDGMLVAGFVIFVSWVGAYPIMLRQMDRQYRRERSSPADDVSRDAVPERPHSMTRMYMVRVWMVLLGVAVLATMSARELLGA